MEPEKSMSSKSMTPLDHIAGRKSSGGLPYQGGIYPRKDAFDVCIGPCQRLIKTGALIASHFGRSRRRRGESLTDFRPKEDETRYLVSNGNRASGLPDGPPELSGGIRRNQVGNIQRAIVKPVRGDRRPRRQIR